MTRSIIERVTCDGCGELREFEKVNTGTMTARIESLTDWVRNLGWYVEGSIRTVDMCPQCFEKLKATYHKEKPCSP